MNARSGRGRCAILPASPASPASRASSIWPKISALLLAAGAVALSSCTATGGEDGAGAKAFAAADWAHPGGATNESGFSGLDQINSGNVGKLGLVSWLDLDDETILEATPLAVDGVLYFTGSYSAVYAVDAPTGKLLWRYDPEIWKHHPEKLNLNLPVNRGVAFADGKVFAGVLDGRLIALDAKSGELVWSVDTIPPDTTYTVTGAPRVFDGKVIIGNGGGDYGNRGYVTAYYQETGEQAWRFYTVPGSPEENAGDPAMEKAAETWTGEYWNTGTGGTAWNGITFDPKYNQVYIGTGNSGPYDPAVRSPGNGDNLYLASIVAVDADTGKYKWHYQVNPREAWDYKATANMIAATLTIDGKQRDVLMQAPTNGFFYVLDRKTGELLSAEKIGKVTWAESIDLKTGRPVERPGIRYESGESVMFPSPAGAHNWMPMSFSPQTGLVYIPYMQLGLRYEKKKPGPGVVLFGGLSMGAVIEDEEDGKGALLAWDPVAQKARWKIQYDWIWNGGTMATAGDLVFQGTADGHFIAYDAASGKKLWDFAAGNGIIAAPISYSVGGKQYVSVLVGYGASNMLGLNIMNVGWKYRGQPRRLLTFALGGDRKLPPSAPADRSIVPAADFSLKIDKADVEPGRFLFTMNCATCHGIGVVSAGAPAPDLRESQIAASEESLRQVLLDGALLQRGMPRFDRFDKGQVRQIHAYIQTMARDAASGKQSGEDNAAAGRM